MRPNHLRRASVFTALGVTAWLVLLGIATAAPDRAQTEQTRETWQRVPDLLSAAGVHPGASVADVGAGDGFLTVRLAAAVGPAGTVYAVDTDAKVTTGLRDRLAKDHITNVKIVVGAEDDPHLPLGALDGVIILNAYHEMPQGAAILRRVFEALKPQGHLVLCEPVPPSANRSRQAQMDDHVLDPALIVDDVRAAGFQLVDRQDNFATNLGGNRFGFVAATRP